jgi:AraC family ethanolamine operon transcriptional activator
MDREIRPAHLLAHRGAYHDMEQQAAQLSGYDQIYRQLSRGAFSGRFTTVESAGGAGLYVEKVNQVIEQFGHVPRDQVGLLFLLGPQASPRLGQRDFAASQIILAGPGTEIEFQTARGTEVCVLTYGAEAFERIAQATGGRFPARGETRQAESPAAARVLGAAVNALIGSALLAAGMGGEAFTAEIGTLIAGIAGLTCNAGAQRLLPSYRRAEIFRQARAMIHEMLDVTTVSSLQRRLNVSRRTLEYAFQETAGMSPQAYISAVRLDAVRRAIKETDDSIGDIAARFGIWHMGRFAGQFRDAFGMLPSEARRR